jgi:hypothetical protein
VPAGPAPDSPPQAEHRNTLPGSPRMRSCPVTSQDLDTEHSRHERCRQIVLNPQAELVAHLEAHGYVTREPDPAKRRPPAPGPRPPAHGTRWSPSPRSSCPTGAMSCGPADAVRRPSRRTQPAVVPVARASRDSATVVARRVTAEPTHESGTTPILSPTTARWRSVSRRGAGSSPWRHAVTGLSGADARGGGSNWSRRGHEEPTMGSSTSGMPPRSRSRISRVVST